MGKAVIWYNPVDIETYLDTAESTYTENSADGFELENLEDSDPSVTWRSLNVNENRIVFDYGAGNTKKTYGVFVANHNIVLADTKFRWEAGTTSVTGDAGDDIEKPDSSDEEYRPNSHIALQTEYRYNALELNKSAGTYTEAGYIFVPQNEYRFDLDFGKSEDHIEWEYEAIKDEQENDRTGFVDKTVHKIRNKIMFSMQWKVDDEQFRKFRKIQKSDYVIFFPFGLDHQGYYGTIEFGSIIGFVESNSDAVTRWKYNRVMFVEAVE